MQNAAIKGKSFCVLDAPKKGDYIIVNFKTGEVMAEITGLKDAVTIFRAYEAGAATDVQPRPGAGKMP